MGYQLSLAKTQRQSNVEAACVVIDELDRRIRVMYPTTYQFGATRLPVIGGYMAG